MNSAPWAMILFPQWAKNKRLSRTPSRIRKAVKRNSTAFKQKSHSGITEMAFFTNLVNLTNQMASLSIK